jgi:hypothetical protein
VLLLPRLAIGHLPPLDRHCGLIIPAIRAIEAAFPVLQNHLAEMSVPALSPIKPVVKSLDAMIQSVQSSSRWELLCYFIYPLGIERNMLPNLQNGRKRILV